MSSVTSIEDKNPRAAVDAYDNLTLKLCHLKSITVLVRAADSDSIQGSELSSIGYALESMVEDIEGLAEKFFEAAGIE